MKGSTTKESYVTSKVVHDVGAGEQTGYLEHSVHQCMRGVEGSTQYTPIAGCLALGRQTRSGVAESPALA